MVKAADFGKFDHALSSVQFVALGGYKQEEPCESERNGKYSDGDESKPKIEEKYYD
jgi:hypothetical protein